MYHLTHQLHSARRYQAGVVFLHIVYRIIYQLFDMIDSYNFPFRAYLESREQRRAFSSKTGNE